jgi:hypothetical protein
LPRIRQSPLRTASASDKPAPAAEIDKPENPSRQIIQTQKRATQKKQQAFLHGLGQVETFAGDACHVRSWG